MDQNYKGELRGRIEKNKEERECLKEQKRKEKRR